MNAGALTALEYQPNPGVMFHCLVFHDVDMLPEDDRILYSCPQQPRHLSVAVNELNYRLVLIVAQHDDIDTMKLNYNISLRTFSKNY